MGAWVEDPAVSFNNYFAIFLDNFFGSFNTMELGLNQEYEGHCVEEVVDEYDKDPHVGPSSEWLQPRFDDTLRL